MNPCSARLAVSWTGRAIVGLAVAIGALVPAPGEARACGGCFVGPGDDTQVNQHRMILSVSMNETTLWDQIQYSGAAESFAWVLPIRGPVKVGLSSPLLFDRWARETAVTVRAPEAVCQVPEGCSAVVEPRSTVGLDDASEEVTVLDQEVVGPYEVVQIAGSDSGAILEWLDGHGYSVPEEMSPVIADYVAHEFGFLALKLVPGEGVSAMRPVRVTTKGASLSLPLRMIAAGTGAITPITLFVVGEGRYETTNFDSFEIAEAQLVWDWDTMRSNYAAVRSEGMKARGNQAWLVERANPFDPGAFAATLSGIVDMNPKLSGYSGDPAAGISAEEELSEDLQTLFGAQDPASTWVTRLSADLSREALNKDLILGAAASQRPVTGVFRPFVAVGEPPCPEVRCRDGACAVEAPIGGIDGEGWLLGVIGAAAFAIRRRRERRSAQAPVVQPCPHASIPGPGRADSRH